MLGNIFKKGKMKNLILLLLVFFIVSACQSAKDAFTLKKKSSGDEFLVEKKSPLVLPPNYGELPLPNEKNLETAKDESDDVKVTLDNSQIKIDKIIKNTTPSSLEKSILKKIK